MQWEVISQIRICKVCGIDFVTDFIPPTPPVPPLSYDLATGIYPVTIDNEIK